MMPARETPQLTKTTFFGFYKAYSKFYYVKPSRALHNLALRATKSKILASYYLYAYSRQKAQAYGFKHSNQSAFYAFKI